MQIIKSIWQKWKKIAHRIAVFQAQVILSIFYFTILLPFGIIFTFTKDKLGFKTLPVSTWSLKNTHNDTLEELKEQF
ncbi:hypothetical protein HY029_06105 [Candidatus Gottesmanbacteria bacterium]|nr:hypothetical protein [Candidatus Gottesmanbacteria bacterium]